MAGRRQDGWPDKVRQVASKLNSDLAELESIVAALSAILTAPPDDGRALDVAEVPAP